MTAYRSYLRKRRGKGRSGERYYVRVPVPKDLRDRFGSAEAIERALKTDSREEAERRRNKVVAEIQSEFDRLRDGGLSSADIEEEAQRHMQRKLVALRDRPGDAFEPVIVEGQEHGTAAWAVLDDLRYALAQEDWSLVIHQAREIARRHGVGIDSTAGRKRRDELCRALLVAEITALAAALALRQGEIPERPAVLNPHAVERDLKRTHMLFVRLEAIRISLATHEVRKKKGSVALRPGYGRINRWCGALDYEIENGRYSVGDISRRDIADEMRQLLADDYVPGDDDIASFDAFMRGPDEEDIGP